MKKVFFILFVLVLSKAGFSQSANPLTPYPNDLLNYDAKTFPHYGLGWVVDSWQAGAPTAWLSGYGGLKIFTNGVPRVSINDAGRVGIGTTNPADPLHVIADYNSGFRISSPDLSRSLRYVVHGGGVDEAIQGNWTPHTTGDVIWFSGAPGSGIERMRLMNNGSVGIGTTNPGTYKLAVNGAAIFTKVQVKAPGNPWPDYVFHASYQLPSLHSVEAFINQHNHLPEVPSAKDVEANGIDIASNQAILLKKIEELTLYIIEQDKRIQTLEKSKPNN